MSAIDFRLMGKNRSTREPSVIHLVICVILVCFFIHIWISSGCIGFPECYFCKTFSPNYLLITNDFGNHSVSEDFTRLIDLSNFTFLMNNMVCNNTNQTLLVLVHSDPRNYEKRLTIRATWGKSFGNECSLMFLVGIPKSTVIQKRLDDENKAHNDLIQGNFVDTYRNLTYKHVMALKWTKYFCPNVKYLLKTDDDIFVNSPSFVYYLNQNLPEKKLMRCLPVLDFRAQRTWRSKWRVTWSEYKFRMYPPFCQGFAILYSFDVVSTLYSKAQMSDYFWIDDVFITGFLANSANISSSTFGDLLLQHHDYQKLIKGDSKNFTYLLGPWNLNVVDVYKLWKKAFKADHINELVSS